MHGRCPRRVLERPEVDDDHHGAEKAQRFGGNQDDGKNNGVVVQRIAPPPVQVCNAKGDGGYTEELEQQRAIAVVADRRVGPAVLKFLEVKTFLQSRFLSAQLMIFSSPSSRIFFL